MTFMEVVWTIFAFRILEVIWGKVFPGLKSNCCNTERRLKIKISSGDDDGV